MPAQREAAPIQRRHRVLDGAAARDLHDPVRHAPPRRVRAPRGPGGGDRLRVDGEAGRVPRRRASSSPTASTTASPTSSRARARTRGSRALFAPLGGAAGSYASWAWLTVLSMLAIMFLPRQFQIAVVENVNENHLGKAIWLFPLYMLAMNLFVRADRVRRRHAFPGGRRRPRHVRADAADGGEAGGARAARVHRRAVGRDRHGDRRDDRAVDDGVQRPRDAGAAAHAVDAARRAARPHRPAARHPARRDRRASCCSATSTSASPAKPTRWWRSGSSRSPRSRSSRRRSSAASTGRARPAPARSPGLAAGFAVWLYTLLLPSFAKSGWLPIGFLNDGPFGIALLKPYALFGLDGLNDITHAMLWSMLANVGAYVVGVGAHAAERGRAGAGGALRRRVPAAPATGRTCTSGRARRRCRTCTALLARFLGRERATAALAEYARRRGYRVAGRSCRPTPGSCSSPRPRSPAPSAAPRRGSWWPRRSRRTRCRSTRCGRCSTRPRRSSPTATSSSRSRRSSWPRRPSCARRTSGCRSSTG